MQNAIWLSSVFGPLLLIIGLWMLCYSDNLVKVMTSIKNTPGCFVILGFLNLILGLGIISMYNVWMMDATVLLTLLGWAWLIRGILTLFIPQLVIKYTMTNHGFLKVSGIIPLVWGLVLCWVAFLM